MIMDVLDSGFSEHSGVFSVPGECLSQPVPDLLHIITENAVGKLQVHIHTELTLTELRSWSCQIFLLEN